VAPHEFMFDTHKEVNKQIEIFINNIARCYALKKKKDLLMSTLSLSSDTAEEGIQSHYRWL
jgi:hypothetical protein